MFHYDITAEDHRIIAHSQEGESYQVILSDNLSGKTTEVTLNAEQLGFLIAFQIAPNGEPHDIARAYEVLNPIFVILPQELRMIP